MDNIVLLSICIPTYNRCKQLKITIESIIKQKEFLDGRVEIVICDNASNDDTSIIGQEYVKKYSNISYYRNKSNIKDKNFPMALSKGKGILRKLHNDTLKLEQNSLSIMCSIVKKFKSNRPVIFFANDNVAVDDENKILSFEQFVVHAGYWITWIGGFSIWEEDCKDIETDIEGCDLRLWQVKKTYELGFKKNECVIFNKLFGQVQPVHKKDISYGIYEVFYENYLNLLKPYVENHVVSKRDYKLIKKDLLYNLFTDLIIQIEINHESMNYSKEEDLKALIFHKYENEPYWDEYSLFYRRKLAMLKIRFFIKKLIGRE